MARKRARAAIVGLALAIATGAAGCSPSSAAPAPGGSAPAATATSSSSPEAGATPTATAPGLDIALATAQRLVTQEGLAIALASNVLQTHLILVAAASDASTACVELDGGGSYDQRKRTVKGATTTLTNRIFFDAACHQLYMTQVGTVVEKGDTGTQKATSTYLAPTGAQLGTMVTSSHATFSSRLELEGTGTFTPTAGGVPVSLGLACVSTAGDDLDCQGGVSQDFPVIGASLGSVTKLRLVPGTKSLTFSGSTSTRASGALGALSIVSKDTKNLSIAGAQESRSGIVTKGAAGGLVLFPPTPTGWTVTDAKDDVAFTIEVTSNGTRKLSGWVTQLSTEKKIATLAVDRSGTGSVTFAGEQPIAISGWLLAG